MKRRTRRILLYTIVSVIVLLTSVGLILINFIANTASEAATNISIAQKSWEEQGVNPIDSVVTYAAAFIKNPDSVKMVLTRIDLSNSDTLYLDIDGKGKDEKVFFAGIECKYLAIQGGDLASDTKLGCGNTFYHLQDFNWAEKWYLVKKQVTWETTFLENGDVDGTTEVQMQNDGVYVGRTEPSGGGIVTFIDHKLVWIHQGD